MKHKFEKNLRIINEMMTYMYKLGAKNISIDYKEENTLTKFTILGNIQSISDRKLDDLKEKLNTDRMHEIEEYYWHLGGESEIGEELSLIGMMIDTADISFNNNLLSVIIYRKE